MGKRLKLLLKLWSPVVVWAGLLFYLSSLPSLKAAPSPFWDEIIRSFLHFVFYTILYVLFFRAINFGKSKKNYIWPFLLTVLYAFSDEIHQFLVPTRTFQVKDLVIDALGGLLGILILWKLWPKSPKPVKNWGKKYGGFS